MVEPGWLGPLLEVLDEDPTAGAVVPMLLNPDGTIQEAGSVIDSVGWPLAFGRGESANAFAHRFRREVDYGSAACVLVRGTTFAEVGGFDPAYGIGYFEDVDLSFKLKERGLRTIYEPRSRVVHELHGSGTSRQAQQRMIANRALFYRRWSERLARRPNLVELPTNPARLVAARDAEVVDRILVLDDRVPFHDRGSGDPRMAKLLFELVDLWPDARVTLAAADGSEARALRRAAPRARESRSLRRRSTGGAGSRAGCSTTRSRSSAAARTSHASAGTCERTQPQALRAFDTEALTFRRLERMVGFLEDSADVGRVSAEANAVRQVELGALHESNVVFAVSDEEKEFIGEVAHGVPTFVLPHWIEPVAKSGRLPRATRPALLRRLSRRRRARRTRTRSSISRTRCCRSSGSATPSSAARRRRRPDAGGRGAAQRARSTSSAMSRIRPSGSAELAST